MVPDLLRRDFSAEGPDQKWVGDFKQVNTGEGPVYLATVEDLFSRRMLGFAQSDSYLATAEDLPPQAHLGRRGERRRVRLLPDRRTVRHRGDPWPPRLRGGDVAGVIFHTDKGSQYTSDAFAEACRRLNITQSMGRVGCALDNAAAESFFSTLEHELVTRRHYRTRDQARADIAAWIDTWYNQRRLHSTNNMLSPIEYELANAA